MGRKFKACRSNIEEQRYVPRNGSNISACMPGCFFMCKGMGSEYKGRYDLLQLGDIGGNTNYVNKPAVATK